MYVRRSTAMYAGPLRGQLSDPERCRRAVLNVPERRSGPRRCGRSGTGAGARGFFCGATKTPALRGVAVRHVHGENGCSADLLIYGGLPVAITHIQRYQCTQLGEYSNFGFWCRPKKIENQPQNRSPGAFSAHKGVTVKRALRARRSFCIGSGATHSCGESRRHLGNQAKRTHICPRPQIFNLHTNVHTLIT